MSTRNYIDEYKIWSLDFLVTINYIYYLLDLLSFTTSVKAPSAPSDFVVSKGINTLLDFPSATFSRVSRDLIATSLSS